MQLYPSAILLIWCINTMNAQLSWTEITPSTSNIPLARALPAVAFDKINNILLVHGGKTGKETFTDDTWIFNITSNTWTQLTNIGNTPPPRFTAIAGYDTTTQQFIIATGEGFNKQFYRDIWSLNYLQVLSSTSTINWIQLDLSSTIQFNKRYGSAGGLQINTSNFYISHGFAAKRFSDTYTFDISNNNNGNWKEVFSGTHEYNPNAPHARCLMAYTETISGFVMYGGCLNAGFSGGPCPALDTWKFETINNKWTQLNDGPIPSLFASMTPNWNNENQVFLYGGSQTKTLQKIGGTQISADNIHMLDINSGKWISYRTLNAPNIVLSQHKMVNIGNGLLVFGGIKNDNENDRSNNLYYLTGNVSSNDEIKGFTYFSVLYLHGILMYISWGCMLQIGVFIARYFRYMDPWWFRPMHLYCQRSGFIINIFGIICAFIGGGVPVFAHGVIGVIIFLLSIFQVVYGECRPHHDEPRRWLFEILHPWSGRTAIILSLINITLGVFCIISPIGVWSVWLVQFCIIVILYVLFELNKRDVI